MTKSVILTGLRANNDLTLGNYFGGMLPIIEMAKARSSEYQINMFIPDLHSFTTPINHDELQAQVMNNARIFVAAGLPLDNNEIHLYRQSYISAHSELTWILDCFTGMGEMQRMTQFKDKSNKLSNDAFNATKDEQAESPLVNTAMALESAMHSSERISVGLFNYPVLMAADILLYDALYVPVGDDQTQHLEYTRDIAERMNSKFGSIFTVPLAAPKQHEFFGKGQGLRIMDLQTPSKKMSKSDESGKGVIFLSDDPKLAAKKVMSATTDDLALIAFDRKNQPGITNLLEILSLLRGTPLDDVVAEFEGHTRYGDFKKVVANEVEGFLTNFQANLAEVDNSKVLEKIESSEIAMRASANKTLLRAQRAVGLRPKE